jgi:hypothetical protein
MPSPRSTWRAQRSRTKLIGADFGQAEHGPPKPVAMLGLIARLDHVRAAGLDPARKAV